MSLSLSCLYSIESLLSLSNKTHLPKKFSGELFVFFRAENDAMETKTLLRLIGRVPSQRVLDQTRVRMETRAFDIDEHSRVFDENVKFIRLVVDALEIHPLRRDR